MSAAYINVKERCTTMWMERPKIEKEESGEVAWCGEVNKKPSQRVHSKETRQDKTSFLK